MVGVGKHAVRAEVGKHAVQAEAMGSSGVRTVPGAAAAAARALDEPLVKLLSVSRSAFSD